MRNVCLLHLRRFKDIDEVESEVHALATGVTTYGLVSAECIAGMRELALGRLNNATATFEAALKTVRAFIGTLLDQLDSENRSATTEPDEPTEKLSGRELEVLRHMADGLSNQAIASALVVSLPTVKTHVPSILVKLAATNRTEAVAKARQRNLLMR